MTMILTVLVGFSFSVSARHTYVRTVENVGVYWGFGHGMHHTAAHFVNRSSSPVNLSVEVTFVNQDGRTETVRRSFPLRPNGTTGYTAIVCNRWMRADLNRSSIRVTILRV